MPHIAAQRYVPQLVRLPVPLVAVQDILVSTKLQKHSRHETKFAAHLLLQ